MGVIVTRHPVHPFEASCGRRCAPAIATAHGVVRSGRIGVSRPKIPPEACLPYDRRMKDHEAGGISAVKRAVSVGAVLIGDVLLIVVAGWIKGSVHLKGELCDGASVWCDGRGDPTPAEWQAEMDLRSVASYAAAAVVASILLLVAVAAWTHRRGDIALAQVFPLLLIVAFVVTWTPYTPV